MREINEEAVEQIAIGASLLGAGGGGDPYVGKMMALTAIKRYGPVRLVETSEINNDDIFLPVAEMGAPSIMTEKFPKGDEPGKAFDKLSQYLNKSLTGTFPMEAGGVNSMLPIVLAAQKGISLVDADGMGRAFPEIQMTTFALGGVSTTPMIVADEKGNLGILETATPKWAERLARDSVVEMGGTAIIALYASTGKDIKQNGILGIVSLCQKIGELVQQVPYFKGDSFAELLTLTNGYHLFDGKVVDVTRTVRAGFNFGTIKFEGIGTNEGQKFEIDFQNENLVARHDGKIVATVPDLICFADYETLQPSTSEAIKYGKRLKIIGLPADKKWRTTEGIEIVGPRYFGYDVDYKPIEKLQKEG